MSNHLARTHTNASKRLTHRNQINAEKKEIFKTVLDNPFHIEWPTVQLDLQRQILADLLLMVGSLSEHGGDEKRQRPARVGRQRKRRKLDPHAGKFSDHDHDDMSTTPTAMPTTAVGSTVKKTSFPRARHLIVGINEVTKSLERQAKDTRHKFTVSDKGNITPVDIRPLIKFVFVCRADIDPPLLVAHLPHLVAACNSCVHAQATSGESSNVVKVVPLPKGAELSLAEAIGFRRAAVLALESTTPNLSNLDSYLPSIPTLVAPWLATASGLSCSSFVPTHVKQILTCAPVDMKAAKQRRVQERQEAKKRRKILEQ